ncbi:hypothetical protein BKA58DRAFT_284810, partial [Alternaria rosae]|uniref:uncharacterized protein n=1 Tax=Alternaria rosae TaxID=1187941 RepID=UPI001E8CDBCE
WGPLTTPWSPPSSCSTSWALQGAGSSIYVTPMVPSDCLPGGSRIHSPGTCYGDYHIVQIIEWRTSDWMSGGNRVFGIACCESGFTNTDSGFAWCWSSFSTPITAYPTEWVDSRSEIVIRTDNATVLSSGIASVGPMGAYWQESDLSKFDPDYAAILASKFDLDFTPTAIATADATAEPASPPDRSQFASATSSLEMDSEEATGLSSGAKSGIGVGVAFGVVLLCAAGFLLYRRRVQKVKLDSKLALQNEQPELVQTRAA